MGVSSTGYPEDGPPGLPIKKPPFSRMKLRRCGMNFLCLRAATARGLEFSGVWQSRPGPPLKKVGAAALMHDQVYGTTTQFAFLLSANASRLSASARRRQKPSAPSSAQGCCNHTLAPLARCASHDSTSSRYHPTRRAPI